MADIKMSSILVNLTAHIVARNIADTLAEAPRYPYQIVYAVPYYQQLLVARVLSGIRNQYIVLRENESDNQVEALLYFLEEQAAIDRLIYESLIKILEENTDWKDHVQVSESMPDRVPDYVPVIFPVIP